MGGKDKTYEQTLCPRKLVSISRLPHAERPFCSYSFCKFLSLFLVRISTEARQRLLQEMRVSTFACEIPQQSRLGPKLPRWSQEGAKMAQDGPKIVPHGSKWAQDGPRWAQDGPKMAQDGPRWPQDGPKMGPRWVQHRSSEAFQHRSR